MWEEARAHPEKAAELLHPAIALFDRVVRDFPDDSRVSSAHAGKGRSLEMLGDPRGALESFRRAVERLRRYPFMRTSCWLEFTFLAARQGFSEHYDEALLLLDEFAEETLPFPILKFQEHASIALIASARGDTVEARAEARLALAAAERLTSDSPHPQHAKLGLVGHHYGNLRDRLTVLARDTH